MSAISWNYYHAFKDGEAWAVFWKEDGTSHFRDFIVTFGYSISEQQAMERVAARLKGDPFFARENGGGTFFPVPVHAGIAVPRRLT